MDIITLKSGNAHGNGNPDAKDRPSLTATNSSKLLVIFKELKQMGIEENYIVKAMKLYEEKYGSSDYNIQKLTEMIDKHRQKEKSKAELAQRLFDNDKRAW